MDAPKGCFHMGRVEIPVDASWVARLQGLEPD